MLGLFRRPPSGSLPANHSPTEEMRFSCHEGLSPASSGYCSWCPQREATEGCFPGHRKGWKQLSALSVSLIKNQHVPRACSPRWFFTTRLGCPAHLLTTQILFSMLIKSTGLGPDAFWLCRPGAGEEWEPAFFISTQGGSEEPGAQAILAGPLA